MVWLYGITILESKEDFFSTFIGQIPPRQEERNTEEQSSTLCCISL
jgi:hypothetical protein